MKKHPSFRIPINDKRSKNNYIAAFGLYFFVKYLRIIVD